LIKKHPQAFTWKDFRRPKEPAFKRHEEFAYCVIVNELAGRAKRSILPKLQNDLVRYKGPSSPEKLLFNYLYYKTEELVDKLKHVPNESSTEKLSYLRNSEGLFTSFTEEEANEIVHKLTQTTYDKASDYTRGKPEEFYSYTKRSNTINLI